jgi:hypothetical protein
VCPALPRRTGVRFKARGKPFCARQRSSPEARLKLAGCQTFPALRAEEAAAAQVDGLSTLGRGHEVAGKSSAFNVVLKTLRASRLLAPSPRRPAVTYSLALCLTAPPGGRSFSSDIKSGARSAHLSADFSPSLCLPAPMSRLASVECVHRDFRIICSTFTSPSLFPAGSPRILAMSGYTFTFSKGATVTPARISGPVATKRAFMLGTSRGS